MNGVLTRMLDPDSVLRGKIVEFVERGDFGFASGQRTDGTYDRIWYAELLPVDEVNFESGVFLLNKSTAKRLKSGASSIQPPTVPTPTPVSPGIPQPEPTAQPGVESTVKTVTLRLSGSVPPEVWNRLGTKVLPKLRAGTNLKVGVEFSVDVDSKFAKNAESDLRQIIDELGLTSQVKVGIREN